MATVPPLVRCSTDELPVRDRIPIWREVFGRAFLNLDFQPLAERRFRQAAEVYAANQIMLGSASTTYTAPGITSAASRAAQSGPTSFVTTGANGNLAATSFRPQDISTLSNSVSALQQDVKRAFEGTAIAIAMGGALLPDNKRFGFAVNWGTFAGEHAAAFSTQVRLNENVVFNAGLGAGFQRQGVGGRAGFLFAW